MTLEPLDFLTLYSALEQQRAPVLVVLTAPGCGACRRVKATLAAMDDAALGVARVVEVDVSRSPGVAAELEAFHLPALYLFVDGDLHAPVHAEARPEALGAAVRAALEAPPVAD